MAVVSEPHKILVGEGKNAKYVKDCKEIFLGNKGIEKIRGFEEFVNLEYLCLNGNKLKKINNLDANFRIKVLNAQDNQICTLKGSLTCFKFLEQLDLSNNQLRDLAKLLPTLVRFQFLSHLNLKDNPCCEEPDYRLQVVHALPNLKVLDQHVITPGERMKARANIGGDVQALTVAFGQRAPARDPAWDAKNPERSQLELELVKEAEQARDAKIIREQDRELKQFSHNPHPDIPRGQSLPPNAGTRRAMETWQGHDSTASTTMASSSGDWQGSSRAADGRKGRDTQGSNATYRPCDQFSIYTVKAGATDLLASGTMLTSPQPGKIGFEQKKYENFVTRRAAGTLGQWELDKKTLKL